jgi:GTP-binding protein Era
MDEDDRDSFIDKQGNGFKSGFVAIVGRPNTGKSTLLNYLAKRKVAIISDKPQTTRNSIRAIINVDVAYKTNVSDNGMQKHEAQIVLIDTPGLHKPKDALGSQLNQTARNTLADVDAIIFMVDASQIIGRGDVYIANELSSITTTPKILVLNKVDKVEEHDIEVQLEVAKQLGRFDAVIPLSASTGRGVDQLVDKIVSVLPEGPKYYPDDMITDQPEKIIAAEFVREQVLELTYEEVPHGVAVEVQEMKSRKDNAIVDIFATIFVERESQKGILIGKEGKMLKEIGSRSRIEIEQLLGSQVFLDLRVRVKKDWRKDERYIRQFGYMD